MTWWWIGVGGLVIAGALYWLLVLSEGVYLGPKVVTWLYDLSARRYDRVKQYEVPLEDATLGEPLAARIGPEPDAMVLDVATGTGRVPMSLLRQEGFAGQIIGLDSSKRMLEQATHNLTGYGERVTLIRQDAGHLPFEDETFDAVTCSEALEFLPDPQETLAEMVRVLRPAGTLLFTNRIGIEATFLPGKVFPRNGVEAALAHWPLHDVIVSRWEVNYDQVWARRAGNPQTAKENRRLCLTWPCASCGSTSVVLAGGDATCDACGATYGEAGGIVDLVDTDQSGEVDL